MKIEKLVDLFYAIIILWLCCIIIMIILFIKNVGNIEKHIIITANEKDTINEVVEEAKQQPIIETNNYQTRLTSFYANDGYGTGSCTGSGLCETNFEINDKGWYTYQGKLVLATATPYLLNYGYGLSDGIETYRYYDEITLNIDGISYQGIVIDSCGICMTDNRIDLFVSNKESVKDTIVEVIK